MAKETSILKLKGMLDGMSFYKTSEGYHVRAKGGIERERIMNDKNFERTRENMNEFANINSAGKLLRNSIGVFMNRAKDTRTGGRLVSLIAQVKNLDTESNRGQRQFATGIEKPEGKLMLEGFEFNRQANLSSILKAKYVLDTDAGTLSIASFHPAEHLLIPESATHVTIGFACAGMDAVNQKSETSFAEKQVIPINAAAEDLSVSLDALPAIGTVKMYYILIEFIQEINGKQYSLNNGAYNALQLIKII